MSRRSECRGTRNVTALGMSWYSECHGTRDVVALGMSRHLECHGTLDIIYILSKANYNTKYMHKVHLSEAGETYVCGYSEDIHRTKSQALTITRLTYSPYTTQIARIRCYTMLST